MAVETQDVRELVDFAPEGYLVTSFYLDVNADEFPAPEHVQKSLDSAMHHADEVRHRIESHLDHEATESIRGDLQKIQQFFDIESGPFKREDTNGVAIFSCSAQGFWEVYQTPTRLRSQVHFEPRPYVAPLATFLSHTKPTAILLTDREQARIFTMARGDVQEIHDLDDYVPHRTEQGGWSQNRYQRRSDHWAQHHIDRAAELVLKLEQRHGFDWLIIGTEPNKRHDVENALHPYVKDRLIGFIDVRIDAPEAEVIKEARQVREEVEQHLIDDLVHRIQEYAGAHGRAVMGLSETLEALNEQRVHILAVQAGFTNPGALCPHCGMLYADQTISTCPADNSPVERVDNVVDSAIQRALELGTQIEVATGQDKLEPIQCIGAILYYGVPGR
ncbi:MAG TPA: Vms1/Ankzf1 family peptidyl-tRNA hydrolase [Chloroflexota bacterium]|nr:Vms1/Ankzf1 family peptidyl-tRNA hydrolase [Chloroflexota bacterium]